MDKRPAILLFLLISALAAECTSTECGGKVCVWFFYGEGCPRCAQIEPLIKQLEQKYADNINMHYLEIYHNLKNYQLFNQFCVSQNIEQRGIPMVVIGNSYLIGTDQIENGLEKKIQDCLSNNCPCPFPEFMACQQVPYNETQVSPSIQNLKTGITWPLIIGSGLVDGINPCAFAVLIFLLSYLMTVSDNRNRMLTAGSAYVAAVYVAYLLAGLGILTIIQMSGISSWIYMGAAVLAILAGLVNVKDYFWYGQGISLSIPKSMKPKIEKWTKKANVPAAIVLGFLVSMFELPCTGGVYLAILAMLAQTTTNLPAIPYLLVYNLMFVLPLVVILGAFYYGMKAEHLESWRSSKKDLMRLGMGALLLVLGAGMLLRWF